MIEIIPNWHPIFVHFTVALLSMSVLFYFLVVVFPKASAKPQWLVVAQWNLWAGAVFAVVTGITGWQAYNSVIHDTESHLAMTDHRNWALGTLAIFLPVAAWSVWRARKNQVPNMVMLFVLAIGFGALTSTAWRGGEAVYRYGLGVLNLPEPMIEKLVPQSQQTKKLKPTKKRSSDGHDHEH